MFIVKIFHPVVAAGIALLPHPLGIALIIILGAAALADTCVTASGIFKMNKKLEHMEQIAQELHSISDTLGENIYKNVMETLNFKDEQVKRLDEAAQEFREKRENFSEELRERREDFSEGLRERREDFSEELRERREDISQELRDHIRDLEARYQELRAGSSRLHRRLVRAFPRMRSTRYSEALKDLQEYFRSLRK